ncbi:hypothetical protein PENSUB_1775 [Penicillium subrubescens]|uniref:Major facilitator superfamily (MFS) profile domain-containing protein n=1 Tax=Penicillium subrubescens TaxID=1316194 RepID=A0A1Q5UJP9_9EURO|nr:hypothetical protein PENSUB_1775 [Penicillium subrubescens]
MGTLSGRDDGIRLEQMPRGNNQDQRMTDPGEGPTQFNQICPEDDWDKKEGWPVVGAGSAIFFVYLGLIYSYGIVQLHLTESRLASVSTLSFIGRLFRSLKFDIMLIMGAIATFPLFVPPFLLPLYTTSIGLSGQVSAAILASWNLASALGRITMGLGADAFLGPVNSMLVSLTVFGMSAIAIWPFSTSLGLLIFFAILNGMSSGGFFSLMPLVVGAVFGDGHLANIMSMLTTSWTFGYFMGAPIAGYLLEAYGGTEAGLAAFRPAFFYAGALTLASAGLILAIRLMIKQEVFARV